ncbi:MAG TPA: TonB-dependent receptor [Thermoanaerobaculia bacterium]|nr:TonB-dependent receptor [Thermoanaerobaculia bacterium]
MATAVLLVLLGALSRLIPHPPNFVALGAIALYSGARLPRRWAWAVPLGAMALSDFFLDFGTGRPAFSAGRVVIYLTFAAIVFAGRFLSPRAGAPRLAAFSVGAAVGFFLTSNFMAWLSLPYPKTPAGLVACYVAGVPFFWNTLFADLLGTAVLFGLDALSRRERVLSAAVLGAALLLLAFPASAQQPPPASESVVVTATSVPEDEKDVGSAITVVTREELEKHESVVVSDVLRSIPGLDVVQSGTPGSVTSLFTRGTNSTQTLVLVDGVRMNSPYFAGYDWSGMTTENIDRIEIARGPFSALYGSDAIGGVVQIFTHPGAEGVSGRATGDAGNQGQGNGSAFVSAGEGPFSAAASYRYDAFDGNGPNSEWRQRNGSASLQARLGDIGRVGVEWGLLDGQVGTPGPIGGFGYPSSAQSFQHEARVSVPGNFTLSENNHLDVLLGGVQSEPAYRDTAGGYESQTDARTYQASISDTAKLGDHTLTAFGSWERWKVDDGSNFGVNLAGATSNQWGLGAQDAAVFGAFTVTAGLRFDHYSTYGDVWSPRGTVSWLSADKLWKVRASGGTGFRAPSLGELYYPFSGNPDLQPEKSVSAEMGAERYVGNGKAEVSLFWNDLKDLIVYDFTTQRDVNIGHARTWGAELGWQQTLFPELAVNVTYMYLRTEDVETGDPLLRRPKNGATLGVSWMPIPTLNLSPRLIYVGSRADADPGTGAPITDPSYLRVDLVARWQMTSNLAPYVRAINLTNHAYEEAAGYPAAGRLVSAGLDVKF